MQGYVGVYKAYIEAYRDILRFRISGFGVCDSGILGFSV